jgi:acetolactate synthase-1/2/3 large subunit
VALDHSPDFEILADAYGIAHGRVSRNEDIPAAIETMLAHKGPYILCCTVDPDCRTGD